MSKGEEFAERIGKVYDAKTCSTARQIGERLGVSRNAVIGWYSRNPELKMRYPLNGQVYGNHIRITKKPVSMGVDIVARRERVKARRKAARKAALIAGEAPAPELVELPPEPLGRYELLDLPANGCKWPSGENPTMFCGEDRGEDTVYCSHHRGLATAEYQPGRRAKGRTPWR